MAGQHEASGLPAELLEQSKMTSSHRPLRVLRPKIAIVGDPHVGKTSLVRVFCGEDYPKLYVMTVDAEFRVQAVLPHIEATDAEGAGAESGGVPSASASGPGSSASSSSSVAAEGTRVDMMLWDCAGQSMFNQRDYGEERLEGAAMIMAVYDVTNASSFQACAKWVAKCRAVASAGSEQRASSKTGSGSGGAVTGGLDSSELGVLVANKIDLADGGGRRAVSEKEGQRFARANNLVYFETSAKANTGVDAPFNELAKLFVHRYDDAS